MEFEGEKIKGEEKRRNADRYIVLLVAIPIGNLGDRYGRRNIMALSLIGVGLSLVEIFIVCTYLIDLPSVISLTYR